MSSQIIAVKPLVWSGYEGMDGDFRVLTAENRSELQYYYVINIHIDDGVETIHSMCSADPATGEARNLFLDVNREGLTVDKAKEIVFEHHKKEVMKLLVLTSVGNDDPEDGSPNLHPVNMNTFDMDDYLSGQW